MSDLVEQVGLERRLILMDPSGAEEVIRTEERETKEEIEIQPAYGTS